MSFFANSCPKASGENDSFTYRRTSEPLLFWLTITGHVTLAAVSLWVTACITLPYFWGEAAATITTVQPNYQGGGLEIYWDSPRRAIQPDKYLVHRRDVGSRDFEQIGAVEGVETRFFDKNADEGASYVYCVEARYSSVTAWLLREKSTVSTPVSNSNE